MRTKLRPVARATDLPSEVLPTPGRPDQAQDRTLHLLHALLHGEVFEDALLDLLQPEMVGVEHLLGDL